jgi:uncharacterized protein involved in response to NO
VFKAAILRHPLLDGVDQAAGAGDGLRRLPAAAGDGRHPRGAAGLAARRRFAFWKPALAFTRLDIGIMYLGYLAIIGQLLVVAFEQAAQASGSAASPSTCSPSA